MTLAAAAAKKAQRRRIRRVAMFVLAFLLVAVAWEVYKAVGPEKGGSLLGVRVLARTNDRAMPHIWDMLKRFSKSEVRGGKETILMVVIKASWYSFRCALLAFVAGAGLGMALNGMLLAGILPWSPAAPWMVAFLTAFTASMMFFCLPVNCLNSMPTLKYSGLRSC